MAWWQRRSGAAPRADRDAFAHLEQFIQTRRGVEAFLEPRTTVTETTVMLIAHDGEWTRRRVPDHHTVRQWGRRLGVPVYDVALVGYPARKRTYDAARRPSNA